MLKQPIQMLLRNFNPFIYMKNLLLTIACLLSFVSLLHAQNTADTLGLKKKGGSYAILKDGKPITLAEATGILASNEQAAKIFQSAKSNNTFASIISGIGGFMVGWPIGTAIGGGEPNWAMAGIGAGLILVALPINGAYNKKAKEAVELYNQGKRSTSFWQKSDINLTLKGNGVGLKIVF